MLVESVRRTVLLIILGDTDILQGCNQYRCTVITVQAYPVRNLDAAPLQRSLSRRISDSLSLSSIPTLL